jgi:hypothetical protein
VRGVTSKGGIVLSSAMSRWNEDAVLLLALLTAACGAPEGRATSETTAATEGDETAETSPAADEVLLARLPEDTMLLVQLDHERLAASPYHGTLVGDEAVLVEAALASHLARPPEARLPEGLSSAARETLFVITLDEVGLGDTFVALRGAIDASVVGELAESAGQSFESDDIGGRVGPMVTDDVESVGIHRPSSGLAFGPLDREEEIVTLLTPADSSRARATPELRRMLARTPATTGARAVIANTRGLRTYLRETFAAQNLTAEIVDSFVGVSLLLDVSDGAELTIAAVATEPDGAEALAEELDPLIAGWAEQPLLIELGVAPAIETRERSVVGDEARFVLRMSDTAFRAALVRLMALVASTSPE